jgi:hypothetical protein
MDFNDIQNAWNKDTQNEVELPTNLDKIKSVNTPLDKIRKKIRNEFYYQTSALLFMGIAPVIFRFTESAIKPFYLIYVLTLAISIYYFIKFYFFYKRINNKSLNTKDNLYETYYDIKLNIEIYKSFGFSLIPFMILFFLGSLYYLAPNIIMDGLNSNKFLITAFLIITISILYMGFATEWWLNHFYGKDLKEIKKILDELKEE